MKCTYTFNEIVDLIENATPTEIDALCALIREEKSAYSYFHLRVIAAALHIHLDSLQLQDKGVTK